MYIVMNCNDKVGLWLLVSWLGLAGSEYTHEIRSWPVSLQSGALFICQANITYHLLNTSPPQATLLCDDFSCSTTRQTVRYSAVQT